MNKIVKYINNKILIYYKMIIKIYADVDVDKVKDALDLIDLAESEYVIEESNLRRSEEVDWYAAVGDLDAKRTTIAELARNLSLSVGTVRNNLIKAGYIPKENSRLKEDAKENLMKDIANGESINDLCVKYKKTPAHIRLLKRQANL